MIFRRLLHPFKSALPNSKQSSEEKKKKVRWVHFLVKVSLHVTVCYVLNLGEVEKTNSMRMMKIPGDKGSPYIRPLE